MESKHFLHGGDLDTAALQYGLNKHDIWDFSGNINPLGTSPLAKEALICRLDALSTYPDRYYRSLKTILSAYCGAPSETLIVGNGSTELISLTIGVLKAQKVLSLGPTYSEYEREVKLCGGTLDYYNLRSENHFELHISDFLEHLAQNYTLLILCNPNNPTSTLLNRQTLNAILDYCQAHQIFVMIDETYIEFCDVPSEATAIPLTSQFDNLLVLRGISKFFAAPGLRFGYGVCSNKILLDHMHTSQNPWSVNSLAVVAVEAMFQDCAYITQTHSLFVRERLRIIEKLSSIKNILFFMPQANFVLIKLLKPELKSTTIMEELLKQNMLIRDASSFPFLTDEYIRFCFLAPHQNNKLLKALTDLLS